MAWQKIVREDTLQGSNAAFIAVSPSRFAFNAMFVRQAKLDTSRRVTIQMHPPIGPPVRIRPRVLVVDPGHELRLRGSLPGIFSGEHWFELQPVGDGCVTRVTQAKPTAA